MVFLFLRSLRPIGRVRSMGGNSGPASCNTSYYVFVKRGTWRRSIHYNMCWKRRLTCGDVGGDRYWCLRLSRTYGFELSPSWLRAKWCGINRQIAKTTFRLWGWGKTDRMASRRLDISTERFHNQKSVKEEFCSRRRCWVDSHRCRKICSEKGRSVLLHNELLYNCVSWDTGCRAVCAGGCDESDGRRAPETCRRRTLHCVGCEANLLHNIVIHCGICNELSYVILIIFGDNNDNNCT